MFGLEARTTIELPETTFRAVVAALPEAAEGVRGKVICDYLRVMWKNPTVDQKFAPGHMGREPGDWLVALAAALEKKGREDLAKQIRSRLDQFLEPGTP